MLNTNLSSCWYPVARSEEITGQPKQLCLLDEKIVLFRATKGVVGLKDVCIHRGAALSLGRVEDDVLTCAYHGWQYDPTGACVAIPSRPDSPIPRKARAIVYEVAEKYGLVWVSLNGPAAPIAPFPQGEFDDPSWRAFLCYDRVWDTSAARAVENFMDFSHFPFVHENILGNRDHAEIEPYEVIEEADGMRYVREERIPGSDSIYHEYVVQLPFTVHLRKPEPNGGTTVKSLFSCPISAKRCRLWVWIVRNHSFDHPDSESGDFTVKIMEQDRLVVESQRPEEIPLDLREELHVKVPDAASLLYRKQLARFGIDELVMP